jgi:glycosyltransferase involved in cell wall biosynthesis
VGRIEAIKGIDTLIDAWQSIVEYDLLIVGSGTKAEELRSRAASNSGIQFLGPKSQDELGNLYFHAQATIVPSITYETFGIIIVESFARKTPVIVRDLGALPEVVQESRGGYIYRTNDELIHAVHKLGHSSSLARQLGENGYNAFVRLWSREAHLALYFDRLEKIAARKYGEIPWA